MRLSNCILVGRYQIFHNGHYELFEATIKKYYKVHVAVCGTSTRTRKNPFAFLDVTMMIKKSFPHYSFASFNFIHDTLNDQEWSDNVYKAFGLNKKNSVVITGCKEDSDFSNLFTENYIRLKTLSKFDATTLRDNYFNKGNINTECIPKGTQEFLLNFMHSKRFKSTKNLFKEEI